MGKPVRKFTKEELNTEEPYQILYENRDTGFAYMQLFNQLEVNAAEVGFKRFGIMVKSYFAQRQDKKSGSGVFSNITNFSGQPMELCTGDWIADDAGVIRQNERQGIDIACTHPIMPILRLVNVDEDTVRLKIAYRISLSREWKELIVNKSTLFNANEIKKLADKDVSVSDRNAAYLVRYIQEMENINCDIIPEKQSVGRLGWVKNKLFSPYDGDLEFDGGDKFRKIFQSVYSKGDFNIWLEEMRKIRQTDSVAKIMLAASFSSVLLKVIGKLNYIVHLWGGSEVGKTVALLLAISVWADPGDDGGYMQTFNGTVVGMELQAGFFNNLPLVLDEFQLLKDKKSFEQTVYLLCEGIGKTRGAKTGGLQDTATWKNCSLTSGESPITHSASGGGAVNRIVEIECREKLFQDVIRTLEIIRNNHGHAGRIFVTMLESEVAIEEAKVLYKKFYKELGTSSTEKQTMAAAAILTADTLATKWIFTDGMALTAQDIEKYLHTKAAVDVGVRGYAYVYDYCVSNSGRFHAGADICYGSMDKKELRIIRSSFEKICEEGGFNAKALLAWMDQQKMLMKGNDGQLYRSSKVNGRSVRCACIDIRSKKETGFIPVDQKVVPFK